MFWIWRDSWRRVPLALFCHISIQQVCHPDTWYTGTSKNPFGKRVFLHLVLDLHCTLVYSTFQILTSYSLVFRFCFTSVKISGSFICCVKTLIAISIYEWKHDNPTVQTSAATYLMSRHKPALYLLFVSKDISACCLKSWWEHTCTCNQVTIHQINF